MLIGTDLMSVIRALPSNGDSGVAETEEREVRAIGFRPAAFHHILDSRLGRPHALAIELTIVVEHFCVVDHEPRTRFALDREGDIAGGILSEVVDRAAFRILEA